MINKQIDLKQTTLSNISADLCSLGNKCCIRFLCLLSCFTLNYSTFEISVLVKSSRCFCLQLKSSSSSEQGLAECVHCRWPRPRSLRIWKPRWGKSIVLGGCVKAWKLGEEEQRLLLLHKDVVVAFSQCFASGYLLPLAPGTGDPWDWFARLHQPSCNAINCEHQAGCQKAMNHNGC